jgi:hypothetical protein
MLLGNHTLTAIQSYTLDDSNEARENQRRKESRKQNRRAMVFYTRITCLEFVIEVDAMKKTDKKKGISGAKDDVDIVDWLLAIDLDLCHVSRTLAKAVHSDLAE